MSNTHLMQVCAYKRASIIKYTWRAFVASISLLFSYILTISPAHSQSADSLTVIDDDQRTVTLDSPPQRIVSLAPSLTELLFSLGVGDRIVGVMDYSDFPPQAASLPVVGRFDMLDMERIISLQPDLIVAWRSGNPRGALQRLAELGFSVYIAEPDSLDSIASHLQRLGRLTGKAAEAEALSQGFRQQLDTLRQQHLYDENVTVFYQVWHSPIISVGGTELINDMIAMCGGTNIFAELPTGPKVNLEDILARNPQVIIASGSTEAAPDWLQNWLAWPDLDAVRGGHLYFIPPDLVQRHSLRALQGTRQMCQYIDQVRNR